MVKDNKDALIWEKMISFFILKSRDSYCNHCEQFCAHHYHYVKYLMPKWCVSLTNSVNLMAEMFLHWELFKQICLDSLQNSLKNFCERTWRQGKSLCTVSWGLKYRQC